MLHRAEAIGGVVRDLEGRPIDGARVTLNSALFAVDLWPEIYASPNSERVIATTDERVLAVRRTAGRDACGAQFGVLVTHPDHITVASLSTAQESRAFSSVQVMKPGVSISGTVLSPFGRPVRDATVVVARCPGTQTFCGSRRTRTANSAPHVASTPTRPNW